MMHRSTKIFFIVSLGILFMSLAGCIGFLYLVKNTKEEYAHLRYRKAEAQLIQNSLDVIEKTKPERDSLTTRILPKDENGVINLLSLLEELTVEQGLKNTKSLTVAPAGGQYDTVTIMIEVEGTYEATQHMLLLLEKIPYQHTVAKAQISQKGEEDLWKGLFEVRFTKFKNI